MRFLKPFAVLLILLLFALAGCRKEKINTDSSVKLEFSEDTIIFDTVFTTIGSVTHSLVVHNRHKDAIKISEIRFAKGNSSQFRMNVDGFPGSQFKDVEIRGEDSIFVFVEVTVDPNQSNSPLIVSDSILFVTNGNQQDVDLVAWGQDANYVLADSYIPGFPPYKVLDCNAVWDDQKPIVVYGYALVDSLCTLTIEAGTQVHFHPGSGLWVYRGGVLKVNGERDREVIFQGDRLELEYRDEPGQWDRIWILDGNTNSTINYAIIKNGFVGLQVETWPLDQAFDSAQNSVIVTNTVVQNMAGMGVFGRNGNIVAQNLLVRDCGSYCLAVSGGGSYDFAHCTFANYWSYENRTTPAVFAGNAYEDIYGTLQVKNIGLLRFTNSIIYGSVNNELKLELNTGGAMNYLFDHCLLRSEADLSNPTHYNQIIKNPPPLTVNGLTQDPVFEHYPSGNYHLFDQSAAKDKGKTGVSPAIDLDGTYRDAFPDLGVYEFLP